MKLTPPIEKVIAGFYNLFTEEWQEARTTDLATTIGVTKSDINIGRRILVDHGSLEYEIYRKPREGTTTTRYRLVDPPEVMSRKIADNPTPTVSYWRADHGEESLYKRGVLKPWRQDETVYVAEPREIEAVVVEVEPKPVTLTRSLPDLSPLRKSEPKALVEATRQYLSRWQIANQHAQSLVDAGLATDTQSILGMLKLDHREDFDTVALVLPYIDELERRITNMEKLHNSLRDKASRVDNLEVELRRTKEHNTRLISARAAEATSATLREPR
jgi:hypothetical protein